MRTNAYHAHALLLLVALLLAPALGAGCSEPVAPGGAGGARVGSSRQAATVDPSCTSDGGEETEHSAGYPVHEIGTCADGAGYTLSDALASCGGDVKYFGYTCSDFPATGPYQPDAERTWTAYFACCGAGGTSGATSASSASSSSGAGGSGGSSSLLDATCKGSGGTNTSHNAGYPVHEQGTCANGPGFTLSDAAADCGSAVKYFGYTCTDFPAGAYQPAERAWTASYGCCASPSCYDEAQDGDETGVDCGGSICGPCSLGLGCAVDSDCTSGYCASGGYCDSPPTCADGVMDGQETDVDCGGPFCAACPDGASCAASTDCNDQVCSGGICQAPTCADGVLNGDETDVDCGGPSCTPCPMGDTCVDDSDCDTDLCEENLCVAFISAAPPPPACDCDTCRTLQLNGGMLPSPTNCTAAAPAAAACRGWTPAGTLTNTNDISGATVNRATHFLKTFTTPCGDFLCSYLPRFNNPRTTPEERTRLHGLLCFSTSGCETCAWDLNDSPADVSTALNFTDLGLQRNGGAMNTVNCSGCHGPGPILPKLELWNAAQSRLEAQNQECVKNGGPKWLCFTTNAGWAQPAAGAIVPGAYETRNGGGRLCTRCHTEGFIKKPVPPGNPNYCAVIRAAFEPGGSMSVDSRNFKNAADKVQFFKDMGVTANGDACTTAGQCCNGGCMGGACCTATGRRCNANADCCSNSCTLKGAPVNARTCN